MNEDAPVSIDLDRQLYKQIMSLPNRSSDVEEFVHEAVRFYVSIRSDRGEETRTGVTEKEEIIISQFLRFMRRADPDLRDMVTHAIELWRKKERLTS